MKNKGGTITNFSKLSRANKAKEVKKLAKRANVRLALMEEKGIQNNIYKYANEYNKSVGRKKNRFFEGVKYNSNKELNNAYKTLNNFLNNKTSTINGIRDNVVNLISDKIKYNNLTYQDVITMSEVEKRKASNYLAKRSNSRLAALEKADHTKGAYKKAYIYNKQSGRDRNRFYTGHNFQSENELNLHIYHMVNFLNSKTSTVKGWNERNKKRINTFRKKGINIPKGKEEEFNDFLESNQFKALKEKVDSNQIMKMYHNAKKRNKSIEEMNIAFDKFMNEDYYFDEVLEELGIAPWQDEKGELLH